LREPIPEPITFKHRWQVRFADTDASGVAHFSSYVRMMEETEYAFLRSRGLSVVLPDPRGTLGFPRLQASFRIHHPLSFEQTVEIHLRLVELDGKQIVYEFAIVDASEGNRGSGTIATEEITAKELAEEILTGSSCLRAPLVEGRFVVACCRFPDGQHPYAVLIPVKVMTALESGI